MGTIKIIGENLNTGAKKVIKEFNSYSNGYNKNSGIGGYY